MLTEVSLKTYPSASDMLVCAELLTVQERNKKLLKRHTFEVSEYSKIIDIGGWLAKYVNFRRMKVLHDIPKLKPFPQENEEDRAKRDLGLNHNHRVLVPTLFNFFRILSNGPFHSTELFWLNSILLTCFSICVDSRTKK